MLITIAGLKPKINNPTTSSNHRKTQDTRPKEHAAGMPLKAFFDRFLDRKRNARLRAF